MLKSPFYAAQGNNLSRRSQVKRILSIDGGGIRGIIPALLLARLESEVGYPINKLFDLVAGTSTGGIIAMGLSCPNPSLKGLPLCTASDLVKLYRENGSMIFPGFPLGYSMGDLFSHGLGYGRPYPCGGLEELLKETFGLAKLGETVVHTLVMAYDIEHRGHKLFSTVDDPKYDCWQVARASSAAPTFFQPVRLKRPVGDGYRTFVDGGMFANNPALFALLEAKKVWPEETDFQLISLGTGERKQPYSHDDAASWCKFRWARPIIDILMGAASDTTHQHLERLLPESRYLRFNHELTEGTGEMDDITPDHLLHLECTAEKILDTDKKRFQELCKQLRGETSPPALTPDDNQRILFATSSKASGTTKRLPNPRPPRLQAG